MNHNKSIDNYHDINIINLCLLIKLINRDLRINMKTNIPRHPIQVRDLYWESGNDSGSALLKNGGKDGRRGDKRRNRRCLPLPMGQPGLNGSSRIFTVISITEAHILMLM